MNMAIAIAVGNAVIMKDQKFMASGGKDVVLSKDWGKVCIASHEFG